MPERPALPCAESRHERIDNAIDAWHNAPPGTNDEPLAEFLGWTWDEYAEYAQYGKLPPEREGAY